ncbi:MAG: FecR domain-containing protein, partial [Nitrosomonas sp.]|nr:FecR domain-containing protein [Nitrosomonas sp.]
FAGDEIDTGVDGFVTLELIDQSHLRIQAASKIRINRLEIFGDTGMVNTEADLQYGRTENTVPKNLNIDSRFQINSPSAVSSVRGTDFRIGTSEEGAITYSEVLAGKIQVSGRNRSISVAEGFGSVTKLNDTPSLPIKLLPAPDLSATPQLYERIPLTIPLKPLTDADAYRVQIATDRAFENLLSDFTSVSLPLRGGELPDGAYWLRIRGRDHSGLEGYEAAMPIKIKARPEPPFVIAPQRDAILTDQNPVFQWTTRPDIVHYLLMISLEEDFSVPVIFEKGLTDPHFRVTIPLAPGTYWWRIASVSETEGVGPFSDPLAFRVPIPGPLLDSTDINDAEITFSWPSAAPGQYFHFQFARDEAFQNILTDMQTHEPSVTLARPDSGRYYLRIKVIEEDGVQGSFSPAQVVEIPSKYPYWLFLLLPLLGLLL